MLEKVHVQAGLGQAVQIVIGKALGPDRRPVRSGLATGIQVRTGPLGQVARQIECHIEIQSGLRSGGQGPAFDPAFGIAGGGLGQSIAECRLGDIAVGIAGRGLQ